MGTTGKLIWSVDFTGHADHTEDARQLKRGLVSMLQTFQEHNMPATWMLPNPASSSRICQEILGRQGQEVGLLADDAWVGAGRNVLARELSRRAESARASGIRLSTMATTHLEGDLDLLVRHRISTIRVEPQQVAQSSRRYGVWQVAAADVLPGRKGMWGGKLGYQRLLRNCVKQQQTVVLVVDGDQVAVDDHAKKIFKTVCRYAARRPGLTVRSLSDVGREMLAVPATTPARSILRAG